MTPDQQTIAEALEKARSYIECDKASAHLEIRDMTSAISKQLEGALATLRAQTESKEVDLEAENKRLRGTLNYILTQAKAAHPGALQVIAQNAEGALNGNTKRMADIAARFTLTERK